MANVNIKFNNKDYLLSCDDGQEDNLIELASHLDLKYNDLKKNLGNIGENKLLLITAIKIIDDYFDLFKKAKNSANDFKKLSMKFNELKSLVINYKDEKKVEIENLKNEINEFKTCYLLYYSFIYNYFFNLNISSSLIYTSFLNSLFL